MSDIAIKVNNLSKRYRIGLEEKIHDTLAGQLTSYFKSPLKNLRQLRQLTRFSDNSTGSDDPEDVIWALKDVSFEVDRGEVVGIIGRNGAGKTTLLKILSRITHPTSGRVELDGRVSSLLEVGTGFHPELTGRENIYLNGTILGMTKAEVDRKFEEIVDFSGVGKFIDTPVKRYSSGMRVRLAFSVAAHLEPEILLVDEVLAVGDLAFQKKSLGKMEEVAGKGRTVLFVSHNMAMINSLTSRALWLDTDVRAEGSTQHVTQSYLEGFSNIPAGYADLTPYGTVLKFISIGDDEVAVAARMGAKITVRIAFRSETALKDPVLGIGIDHPDQGRVATLSTAFFENAIIPKSVYRGTFCCHINQLFLNQGAYYLTIQMNEGGKRIARIENACKLEVLPGHVFENYRVPARNQGVIFLPHFWTFEG